MARPVAVDPHDRRRSPSQRRTSPSHQLRRTPGEKQRPRSYKPPGQTVNTADSPRTMSGALDMTWSLNPFAGSGVGFDLVAQDEVGAGVTGFRGGQVLAQLRDGGGGPLCRLLRELAVR